MVTLGMVTIDAADARALADWWAERLGGKVELDMDGAFCMVQAPGFPVGLGVQRVDDPTPGKNRLHFDFSRDTGSDHDAFVAEWIEAGATHLGRRGGDGFAWDTFADPEGNEFCVGDPEE